MSLSSLAAPAAPGGLAAFSQNLLIAGMSLIVVMTLAYLSYTVGSARLARRVAAERVASRKSAKAGKQTGEAASAHGGVATLTRSEVILHEQPDGEQPIALNRSLLLIGRVGSLLGWLAVLALFLGLVLRTVVEQHAPWSNLYEFSLSFTTALLLCYLIFEARFHERVRAWGLYICALSIISVGIAFSRGTPNNRNNDSRALIPAL